MKIEKMKYEGIPFDEEQASRGRESRIIQLESVRTPPGRGRSGSSSSQKTEKPGSGSGSSRKKTAEAEDPIQNFFKKYSWYIQIIAIDTLYFYSLTKCSEPTRKCQKNYQSYVINWVIALLISAYITVTAFLSIFQKLARSWIMHNRPSNCDSLTLLATIFNYFFLCSLHEGLSWSAHGTFSRIVFNYFLWIIAGVRLFNFVMKLLKKTDYRRMRFAGYFLVYGGLFLFAYHRIFDTKDSFFKGFDGKAMKVEGKLCKFHDFKINYYSAFDDLFWRFSHSNSDCGSRRPDLKFLEGIGKEEDSYFAYPLTQTFNNSVRQHYQMLQEEVVKGIKAVRVEEIKSSEKEVFINVTDSIPKIIIDVKRNESAVKRAKDIIAKDSTLSRPNVLFLLIDSLSREHFFRKMPKTKSFIEERYFKSREVLSAYQFFRYHSLSDHSEPNLVTLRYDDVETIGEESSKVRIERYFQESGWVTSTASAKCEIDEFDISPGAKNRVYPDHQPADHEFYSLACDPNSTPSKDPFGMFKGPFSEFRRCLYGKDAAAYQLDYALDFFRKYKSEPKFQSVTLMDGHEFTGELPAYLDEHLVRFFEVATSENLLEDSIIFLVSDNGNGGNFLFSGTESGKNEAANPFLTVLLSKNNAEKYGETLKANEQRLLSPHDVFRSLGELSHQYKEYVGRNFFLHEVEDDRRCNDNTVNIDLSFCRCK